MDNKLLEEEMRVINSVVDKVVEKKIAKLINKLSIEVDKLEKRISNFEKGNRVICKSPWIKVDMVALFLPQDVAQL